MYIIGKKSNGIEWLEYELTSSLSFPTVHIVPGGSLYYIEIYPVGVGDTT